MIEILAVGPIDAHTLLSLMSIPFGVNTFWLKDIHMCDQQRLCHVTLTTTGRANMSHCGGTCCSTGG